MGGVGEVDEVDEVEESEIEVVRFWELVERVRFCYVPMEMGFLQENSRRMSIGFVSQDHKWCHVVRVRFIMSAEGKIMFRAVC